MLEIGNYILLICYYFLSVFIKQLKNIKIRYFYTDAVQIAKLQNITNYKIFVLQIF